MSVSSEKVKVWRKTCKDRIVLAMGGKCCCCGYDRCTASLALHHLDPSQKDFGLGAIRANPKSWLTIVEEIRKCVLVCHNCHNEIHAGMRSVPEDAPRFNELYADYKALEAVAKLDECPQCGKLKRAYLKNCSLSCSSKSKFKVDWDSVDLKEEIKTKTVIKIAEELKCSDASVHKRLKKLGLK